MINLAITTNQKNLSKLRKTFPNISFKNLHHDIFNRINDKIDNSFKDLEGSFLELESIIYKSLEKENIEFSIYHRKKNPYSIWKKINKGL